MKMNNFLKNINQRYLSAIILVPVTFLIIIIGGSLFNLAVLLCAIILIIEFISAANISKKYTGNKALICASLYIALPAALLINMRYTENGVEIILYLISIVSVTDTSAYFGGRYFKGIKLAPKISPNKTVSGAVIAIIASFIFAFFAYFLTSNYSFYYFIAVSLLICIISQIGDLLESFIKRKMNIKDSGSIIPGHGGLFDRVDGLLPAIIISYIFL
jgi:phosphatidate cytidylyltransferase